jgi:hypothetical protein
MISKPKYASIETFDKQDLRELFDFVCDNIIHSTPLKVKRDILKLKGSDTELQEYNPTVQSILTLIATYDLKFEFMIKYVESVKPDFSLLERDETTIQKEMSAQKKDIAPEVKKSERIVEKKVLPPVAEEKIERKAVVDDDLPEFN